MSKSLIEVLTEIEEKRKQESKLLLDEILSQYEKKTEKVNYQDDGWSDADSELWNYLCGSGDIQHLYNYYELKDNG